MTIRELCDKNKHCFNCTLEPCCPYNDYWDIPLNRINDNDDKTITKAIIETSKALLEVNND